MRSAAPGLTDKPLPVVYELLGEVMHPGIYRYAQEQTSAYLAADCGAAHVKDPAGRKTVASGTCLIFTASGPACTSMNAAVLLSYFKPISLAAASAEDLMLIPGIGPKTARALIDYRERAGPVDRIDQLAALRGIGPKTLKKLSRHLKP